ncbi:hypothetical protein ACLI4R_01025 [Natrialbaceae archaeon A-chndr2]
MGVRPPTNGGDDEPESIEFGIAAVDARLKRTDIEFPATEADVREALGTTAIPYDVKGNSIALGKALEAVDVETFESRQELLNALHPVFEHYREERSGGLLGRVRSLFGR